MDQTALLFAIAAYLPVSDAPGPPLALSCASPAARAAVECMCSEGFVAPHLRVRLSYQPPVRPLAIGAGRRHGSSGPRCPSPVWPFFFPRSDSPSPVTAPLEKDVAEPAAAEDDTSASSTHTATRLDGPVAALPPLVCGGPEMAAPAKMMGQKQQYPLLLPGTSLPSMYTRIVSVDGTKLPRTLHTAIWWLRRASSVPLVLLSPFMRGRLAVYPLLNEQQMESLSLPEFSDDKSQMHLLAHNAELRARFVAFAGPVLPFLLDVELPECDRAIDLSPLSEAVNMIRFSVSGNGVYDVNFLQRCERLEYVNVAQCRHLTDLAPLTVTAAKCAALSTLTAAATGITDTAHFLSARCTALSYLDVSRCTQLKDFTAVGTLTNLQQLNLSYTAVETLEWIGGCVRLEELHVVECTRLVDLSPLSANKYMDVLNASGCAVRSLDFLITHCPFLYRLHLDECRGLTDFSAIAQVFGTGALGWLSVAGCGPFTDLDWLRAVGNTRADEGFRTQLRVLNVSNCSQLLDAGALEGAAALTTLNISSTAVRNLSWLPSCTALEDLNMCKCPHVERYDPLYTVINQLRSVNLAWCGVGSPKAELIANPPVTPKSTCQEEDGGSNSNSNIASTRSSSRSPLSHRLVDMDFSNCTKLSSLAALTAVAGSTLRRVTVAASNVNTVSWLESCTALRVLHLSHCGRLPQDTPLDLSPLLSSAATLVELNLAYTASVADLSVLRACTSLLRLSTANCPKVDDLEPLRSLVRLESLNLSGCGAITSVDALRGCLRLRQLNLSACAAIAEFAPVGCLQDLRRLDMSATSLKTVSWIRRCRALEEVNVSRCAALVDIQALGKLPNLARLNIANSGVLNAHGLQGICATDSRGGGGGGVGVGGGETAAATAVSGKRSTRVIIDSSQINPCHVM